MKLTSAMHAHLVSCFTGAALDNLFRAVAVVALGVAALHAHPHDPAAAEAATSAYSRTALMLFSLPFILCAPAAGAIGDLLPKHRIIRAVRLCDVPICILGILGFALHSPALLLCALCLLAVASSFFAPVKLAVVPELAPGPALPGANAAMAAVTVVAILLGTCLAALTDLSGLLNLCSGGLEDVGARTASADLAAAASHVAGHGSLPVVMLGVLCAVLCVVGMTAAFRMPALPAAQQGTLRLSPHIVVEQVRTLIRTPGVGAPAVALAGFWALGGVAAVGVTPMAIAVFHVQTAGTVALFLALVVGIVIGSLLAPRLTHPAFPAGLPIIGALIGGSSLLIIGWHAQSLSHQPLGQRPMLGIAGWLVLCGFGAGLWEVPLTVLVQKRSPEATRTALMAGVSVLGSLGTFLAAGAYGLLCSDAGWVPGWLGHHSSATSMALLGGATVVLALGYAVVYRTQLTAWFVTSLVRRIYRVRVHHAERFPESGGCIIACNHLSFADGLVMAAILPRPGRFLVYRRYTQIPVLGWLLRAAGVIPVAADDSRRALIASIDAAVAAASQGECVVIFPEGKITRSGVLDTFHSGVSRIAARAGVPVVPAFLHGLYGTLLSRSTSKGWPRLWRRLELVIGSPLPATASAVQIRDQVVQLSFEHALAESADDTRTLAMATLAQARRRPFAIAVRDAQGTLTRWKLLAAARSVIPLLGLAADEQSVGVVLPPGRGGAIINVALALAGRTAVNLNHTAGPAQLARMCELAGVRTIISSRLYLSKIGNPQLPGRVLRAEELLPQLKTAMVLAQALGNYLLPARLRCRGQAGDVAAVIFSSGSTGDPKGVALTHRQLLANCRSVLLGLDLHSHEDTVLSPLPLFHSFGLVPGMWLGLSHGLGVASQADPTDGKALSELAGLAKATFLISTPTFVRGYLRRADPAGFAHLRFAVVGAERCPLELKQQFKERFNADLLEGYGCTELAPVVATNLPDAVHPDVTERRNRHGAVGRALPGQHALTVDPATREVLPCGAEGLIVVRSAARMQGYLGRPDLTAATEVAGGYATGDIGRIDQDGFIFITGRLARFAKIGGEMVPLDTVEAAVQSAVQAQAGDQIEVAVAAVPDPSRGERLVVMHTGFTGAWEALFAGLPDLPALWRPKPKDVYPIPAVPRLGTGKRDLAAIKKLAAEVVTAGAAPSA